MKYLIREMVTQRVTDDAKRGVSVTFPISLHVETFQKRGVMRHQGIVASPPGGHDELRK